MVAASLELAWSASVNTRWAVLSPRLTVTRAAGRPSTSASAKSAWFLPKLAFSLPMSNIRSPCLFHRSSIKHTQRRQPTRGVSRFLRVVQPLLAYVQNLQADSIRTGRVLGPVLGHQHLGHLVVVQHIQAVHESVQSLLERQSGNLAQCSPDRPLAMR